MSFASLLDGYEGDAAAAAARAPAKKARERPARNAWSQLSRGARDLRRALERGGARALREGQTRSDRRESRVLAVCFTVVDGLPHEAIWREWAERCARAERGVSVRFYVHAHKRGRAKASSAWVSERVIRSHYETTWGSVELVRATLALLDDALDDGFSHVAFASETCVPICTPEALRDLVDGAPSRSRFLATGRPNNGYAKEVQWGKVDAAVAPDHATDQGRQGAALSLDRRRGVKRDHVISLSLSLSRERDPPRQSDESSRRVDAEVYGRKRKGPRTRDLRSGRRTSGSC